LYAGKAGIEKLLNTGSPDGEQMDTGRSGCVYSSGWFYHAKEDDLVKTPEKLFNIYLTSVGRGSTLLLNVPPDRRGLFHENDVKSLYGFKALLKKEFSANLAKNAKITASSFRGNTKAFSAGNITDGNKNSYWSTNDDITSGSFEISLAKTATVKYILLQEYIKLGQRVKSFTVEIWRTMHGKKLLMVQPLAINEF
jgi:alpha-L-fucosidase